MEFEQKPQYRKIKKKFTALFKKMGYKHDSQFDWVKYLNNEDALTHSTADTFSGKNFFFQKK